MAAGSGGARETQSLLVAKVSSLEASYGKQSLGLLEADFEGLFKCFNRSWAQSRDC